MQSIRQQLKETVIDPIYIAVSLSVLFICYRHGYSLWTPVLMYWIVPCVFNNNVIEHQEMIPTLVNHTTRLIMHFIILWCISLTEFSLWWLFVIDASLGVLLCKKLQENELFFTIMENVAYLFGWLLNPLMWVKMIYVR